MKKSAWVWVMLVLLVNSPALASDWSGRMLLGVTDSSGNTNTSSANGELDTQLQTTSWQHELRARGRRVKTDNQVTVERYRAGLKSDYNFTEYNYFYVTLDYEQDRPANVRWRTSETVGYGRRLVKRETLKLDVEVGAGLRQSKSHAGRERENDTIGRLAMDLVWEMAEGREFSQQALVEDGKNNTYVESITALHTNLAGNVFSEVSYTVQRNSNVAAGIKNTDRYFSLTLGYEF